MLSKLSDNIYVLQFGNKKNKETTMNFAIIFLPLKIDNTIFEWEMNNVLFLTLEFVALPIVLCVHWLPSRFNAAFGNGNNLLSICVCKRSLTVCDTIQTENANAENAHRYTHAAHNINTHAHIRTYVHTHVPTYSTLNQSMEVNIWRFIIHEASNVSVYSLVDPMLMIRSSISFTICVCVCICLMNSACMCLFVCLHVSFTFIVCISLPSTTSIKSNKRVRESVCCYYCQVE